jgi:hypothetical protein
MEHGDKAQTQRLSRCDQIKPAKLWFTHEESPYILHKRISTIDQYDMVQILQ